MIIEGNIVDVHDRQIYYGSLTFEHGIIRQLSRLGLEKAHAQYILPGFVDAHVHIESSMLVPSEFARLAVRHGTVATVSDPHEIANVLGVPGVQYMLENALRSPLKFHFGAPSCVPATSFETAGAVIDSIAVKDLLERPDIYYLAEMMNYPGVLFADPEVMAKIHHAHELGKPVDGHAPGLMGDDALKYINAGITTDHECVTLDEAMHKVQNGMKIIIREGSAAKNFEALHPVIARYPQMVMFCSDDKHPDDLVVGHINQLASRSVALGYDVFDVLRAASVNPVEHYKLTSGLLRPTDPADFTIVKNLRSFEVVETYLDGECVFSVDKVAIPPVPIPVVNQFSCVPKSEHDFKLTTSAERIRVIKAIDGSLLTEEIHADIDDIGIQRDILKICVINRYSEAPVAICYIHGFGLKNGAIASSVAHDSHNIVSVGTNDTMIAEAVNAVIACGGGICAVNEDVQHVLGLPIAGLMSDLDGEEVARLYTLIDQFAKETLGSSLTAPFMTLSFMALLVIPQLKLSDTGLFDGASFQFVDLEVTD